MSTRLSHFCSAGNKMFTIVQCLRGSVIQNSRNTFSHQIRPISKPVILRTFSTLLNPNRSRQLITKVFDPLKSQSICCLGCKHYSKDVETKNTKDTKEIKEEDEKKLTLYQKFKLMYKRYWYVLIPVHIVTSITWAGTFYYLVVTGVDVAGILEAIHAPISWIETVKNSQASTFVAVYAMYKIITPIRYSVTLGGTTIAINILKKWGWIKPVPNAEKIKQIYQGHKDNLKDKMQVQKDGLLKTKDEFLSEWNRSVIETKHEYKANIKGAAKELKEVGGFISRYTKRKLANVGNKKPK